MNIIDIKLIDLENERNVLNLGYVGENERVAVMIDCRAVFDEYQDAGVSMAVRPPRGESYPVVVSREGDIVKWIVTDSDLICNGNGEIQLVFVDGDTIVKTAIGKTVIERSIVPTGEAPEPVQRWLDQVDQIIAEIEQKAEEANRDANRAEQAASNAGFMEMEIDDSGHLIYTKSEAIGNKFDLDDDGHLILEVG